MEQSIGAMVDQLLDRALESGETEIVSEFAQVIPLKRHWRFTRYSTR